MKIGFSFLNFYVWFNAGFRNPAKAPTNPVGRPPFTGKVAMVAFLKSLPEMSLREKAKAANNKFGTTLGHSVVYRWLKEEA
jgi:hypothetical protein